MNSPITFWLGIYLGGVVAMTLMIVAQQLGGDEEIEAAEILHALFWPVLLPWFLIEVALDWRS